MNHVGDMPAAIHVANLSTYYDVAVTFCGRWQAVEHVGRNRVAALTQVGIKYGSFTNPTLIFGTQLILLPETGGGLTSVLIVIVLSSLAILVAELVFLSILSATIPILC